MRDSILIINWGMRFLRGGGESSVESIYSLYSKKYPSLKIEIVSAWFCYGKSPLQDRQRDFPIKLLPSLVFYWSSCSTSSILLTWFKRFLKWGSLFLFEIFSIAYAFFRHRRSLIICSDLFICYFVLSWLLPSANVVLRLHGPVKASFHRLLIRRVSGKVITNGRDDLPVDLNADRIIRITPPLPHYFYVPPVQIRHKWQSSERRVVFAGRLELIKGADRIVDYVQFIKPHLNVTNLTICGDGSLRSKILVQQHYLGKIDINVEYIPQLTRTQVADLLISSHVVIVPSRQDFSPNIVREALAAGCVVIVSPEIAEQFSDKLNIYPIESISTSIIFDATLLEHGSDASHHTCEWQDLLN